MGAVLGGTFALQEQWAQLLVHCWLAVQREPGWLKQLLLGRKSKNEVLLSQKIQALL